jgi:dTDP-4-amino-4,6-dideoxygalactose transaminase
MLNTPFSPWPSFTAEEATAVQQVLLSNKVNYWTGTECREFEKEFAAWAETKYAVALSNGTWRWTWRCKRWALARVTRWW